MAIGVPITAAALVISALNLPYRHLPVGGTIEFVHCEEPSRTEYRNLNGRRQYLKVLSRLRGAHGISLGKIENRGPQRLFSRPIEPWIGS